MYQMKPKRMTAVAPSGGTGRRRSAPSRPARGPMRSRMRRAEGGVASAMEVAKPN
jgi:hypothetical protein